MERLSHWILSLDELSPEGRSEGVVQLHVGRAVGVLESGGTSGFCSRSVVFIQPQLFRGTQ